jgi:tRNA pseudouridine65 synthase
MVEPYRKIDSDGPPPVLNILYQDEYLVAIDKPAGLFVHRSLLDKREKYFALQLLRDQIGQYVYPIHRLDRPTSGVLLFALNEAVARSLNDLFISKEIQKTYLALVRGHLSTSGVVDYPLKEKLDKIADKDANPDKEAQTAVTHYQSMATASLAVPLGKYDSVRYSLVKLMPETGRRHQIRRHLAHLRYPIIGDINYGDNKQNPFFGEYLGFRRLMLHARSLVFTHPVSSEKIEINAPLDNEWQQVFEQLGWQQLIS